MPLLWLDTETYSECDLRKHGTHRYADHPSTEMTVAQWAVDDGEPVVEDLTGRAPLSTALRGLLADPEVYVVAHNSAFDRNILRTTQGIVVPIERWIDTMVQAYAHGLPGGLDKVGEILGLAPEEAKDKRGRELINLFCKPMPKNRALRRATRETHPVEWAEFLEYSRQDIVAMRAISKKLPRWNYWIGKKDWHLWHIDQRINDRGMQVDLHLADAAVEAVDKEQKRLKLRVSEATGEIVDSASRRDLLLAYICAEYGVDLPDLRADTVRRRLEDPDLPQGVKELLSIRLEATRTSTAKYKALINSASADSRLRNTRQFMGASRTGRFAHRLFQPGNLPRPNMLGHEIEFGIERLLAGDADAWFGDVINLSANAIRGCIVAPPGRKIVVADYSNIEGRGLAFLAGEEWKLDAFRRYDTGTGFDLYALAYARAMNVAPEDVMRDKKEGTGLMRQIGKVMELGLGYEGGVAAFLTFAAVYGLDLLTLSRAVRATTSNEAWSNAFDVWRWAVSKKRTLGLDEEVYVACEVLKRAWRDAHPATEHLWKITGEQVRNAIANPGVAFPVGQHIKVQRDGAWLRARLPSGRCLCYLKPSVADDGQISYYGVSPYSRQWTTIKTYGGKTVENLTQAFARDILVWNQEHVEEAGYEIVCDVHDENLTEVPDTPEYSVERLCGLMATPLPWAPGMPLAVAGAEMKRYHKGD